MPQRRVHPMARPPRSRACCFSFAAYAKAVIDHLGASGIPVADGLSDAEFSGVESAMGFEFPPDLRAILREGLPVGAGFPDWRSASAEHLGTLLRLPTAGLLREVAVGHFWCEGAWGPRPSGAAAALGIAKSVMDTAPPLVPLYKQFYISSRPNLAGNPVFLVCGGDVLCSGFDLTGFFLRQEVKGGGEGPALPLTPPWAATSARRIDVWTNLVEGRTSPWQPLLRALERELREGGWAEGEVKEMLAPPASPGGGSAPLDRRSVAWHVRQLAASLRRAGWSREDVAYSMGVGGGGDSRLDEKRPRGGDDRTTGEVV